MFKILNIKLMMIFVAAVAVGGISVKSLSLFSNVSNSVDKQQKYNVLEEEKSSDNDLNLLVDEGSLSNDSDDSTNIQDNISSNVEEISSSSIPVTNDYQEQEEKMDVKSNINEVVEVQTPVSSFHYDRTTSIYDDDRVTLLRVEYYVNNKLTYYSEIEQFDALTKSYVEKIYECNLETNIDPLIRTDIYVNGILIRSY